MTQFRYGTEYFIMGNNRFGTNGTEEAVVSKRNNLQDLDIGGFKGGGGYDNSNNHNNSNDNEDNDVDDRFITIFIMK